MPVTAEDIQLESELNSSEIFFWSKKYIESEGEWELKGVKVFQSSLPTENESLATLVYQVSLERKFMLYVLNLLVPAAFLLILDLASYFIPEPSGEKLGFKITVILGFSVLQLLLSGILPSNGSMPPLIGRDLHWPSDACTMLQEGGAAVPWGLPASHGDDTERSAPLDWNSEQSVPV
ncbi:UNVERIFIED_CONTAM: hypothetical protein FKN15_024698 [Acipenser sinensis]